MLHRHTTITFIFAPTTTLSLGTPQLALFHKIPAIILRYKLRCKKNSTHPKNTTLFNSLMFIIQFIMTIKLD